MYMYRQDVHVHVCVYKNMYVSFTNVILWQCYRSVQCVLFGTMLCWAKIIIIMYMWRGEWEGGVGGEGG